MGINKELDRMYWEERFLNLADDYDCGNISALEVAIEFRKDNEYFEQMMNMRKSWMDEYRDEIVYESEEYGSDGYNGFIFSINTKKTYDFKSIPAWLEAKNKLTEIEEKAKLTLQLQKKGIAPVDFETGEILPIPQVKQTTFLKCEKSKNK